MRLAKVQQKLQKAVELEFATIPPYLTAWFSIPRGTNPEASSIIRSVFMEEMLHMVLAANLLNSIGGKVQLNQHTIPQYPLLLDFEGKVFRDRDFVVNLEKLSPASLCTFMKIELPAGWHWQKNAPKICLKCDKEKENSEETFDVSGYTIGSFYQEIENDLEVLVKEAHGDESKVFIGSEKEQIDINYYWGGGGKPVKVTDLASAKEAISVIVEQGEGSDHGHSVLDGDHEFFKQREEVAHFYRFREILAKRYYKPNDNPDKPPTGKKFKVSYKKVSPIKTNCTSIDFLYTPALDRLNKAFNQKYTLMLKQMEEGLNGNPPQLYSAIMNGMHALAPIAYEMAEIPIYNNPDGETGAPSFEWDETGLH